MTKKIKKLIVNMLSLIRIFVAIILPFLMFRVDTVLLIIFLSTLLFTDALDGFLARKWEVSTVGGALLDPIGDKLLAISMMLSLCKWNKAMLILFILEMIISIINVRRVLIGINTSSSLIGKIKTWFLGITIMLIILHLFFENAVNKIVLTIFMVLTILFEVATIVSYMLKKCSNEVIISSKREYESLSKIITRLFDENKYQEDVKKPLVELLKK